MHADTIAAACVGCTGVAVVAVGSGKTRRSQPGRCDREDERPWTRQTRHLVGGSIAGGWDAEHGRKHALARLRVRLIGEGWRGRTRFARAHKLTAVRSWETWRGRAAVAAVLAETALGVDADCGTGYRVRSHADAGVAGTVSNPTPTAVKVRQAQPAIIVGARAVRLPLLDHAEPGGAVVVLGLRCARRGTRLGGRSRSEGKGQIERGDELARCWGTLGRDVVHVVPRS